MRTTAESTVTAAGGSPRGAAATDDADSPSHGVPAQTRPRWFDYVFLVAGLTIAVTTRPAMWALVFAVVAALGWSVLRGSARWGQVVAGVVVVVAAAFFYSHRHSTPASVPAGTGYVEEDQMFQLRPDRLAEMAKRAGGNLLPVFDRIVSKAVFGMPLGTPLNLVLDAAVVVLGVGLIRTRPLWGMFVGATLLMVLAVPKPQERYFLPVQPLLIYAWWEFVRRLNHRLPARWADLAFVGLFVIGAAPNGAQTLGFVMEQRHPDFLKSYKEGRYASVYEAADMIRDYTPPSGPATLPETTWVMVPPKFARILTYLSGRYADEPDNGTPLSPGKRNAWVGMYVLEPSDPGKAEAADRRGPTVHEWLAARGFEVAPEVIAEIPNDDPDAKENWTLHRIRPKGSRPPTTRPGVPDGDALSTFPDSP